MLNIANNCLSLFILDLATGFVVTAAETLSRHLIDCSCLMPMVRLKLLRLRMLLIIFQYCHQVHFCLLD